MKLLVVRHGRTDWNDMHKVQGIADIELNEKGKEQARQTAEILKDKKIDLIICSPLIRTRQTAEIINEDRNIEIIYDKRIQERDFGEFEGLNKDIFGFYDFWTYNKNIKYEKAENVQDFFKRIYTFLDEIKEIHKGKNVLLVLHGGVSVALDSYFNGLPPENEPTSNAMKNCEVREYEL